MAGMGAALPPPAPAPPAQALGAVHVQAELGSYMYLHHAGRKYMEQYRAEKQQVQQQGGMLGHEPFRGRPTWQHVRCAPPPVSTPPVHGVIVVNQPAAEARHCAAWSPDAVFKSLHCTSRVRKNA